MREQLALLPEYLAAHLQLTLAALIVGIAISVPLGILITRVRSLERPVMGVASVIQTIPSLALLAVMVPLLSAAHLRSIGFLPAFIGLVLYSLLPILRNTVTGISGVDPAYVEAARGVGMTPRQQLLRVELPLAMPVIIAGVRTSTVWTVGVATLSTPVGATSLGNYIFSGLQTRNFDAVFVGCVAAAALALALDGFVRLLARGISRRRRASALGSLGAVLLLCAWTTSELHSKSPLVDVRAVRHPAVAGANVGMFVGGIGMYLLLTLITRYAQTPHSAGYGFGLTTFVAGLSLVPFSLLGFIAGKLTPRLRERIGAPVLLAGSAAVVLIAFILFATDRSNLAELFVAMAVLGFGVGSFSAAMPGVILAVTPHSETSSAMSFNQVVRSVGFSLGSAIGGLVLAAGTDTGHLFPTDGAYTTAALVGVAAMAVTAMTSLALARQRSSETQPVAVPVGTPRQAESSR